jgi:hypothetical protein
MSEHVAPVTSDAPSAKQTSAAYGQYGLHHYQGNVAGLKQVDDTTAQHDRARHGPLVGAIMHLVNGSNEVDDQLTSTAKSLKQGLDLRSAPSPANSVYQGIPHETLYESVTQGVNPGAVTSASDTWLGIGNKLAALQSTVAKAIASTEVSWTGKAAESARQSIATLGNQSGAAGQSAQLAGVLTARQAEALTSAKNTVPPPPKPPYDPQAAQQQLQTITDPVAFGMQAAKDQALATAQRAAHQQAAHVVQQYDRTVAQTSASMPAFAPAPKVVNPGGPPSTPMPTLPGGGGPGPGGNGPTAPGSGTPGPTGTTLQPDPGSTGHGHTQVTPVPPGTGPQTTTTSSTTFAPPTSIPQGLPGQGLGAGNGLPGGLSGEQFPGGGFLPGGGFGAGGAGTAGSNGPGGAGRGFGGAATAGETAGESGRSGAGAGAGATAEEAAMAERAGARGASSGMGGMGAGRGQRGKEDAEHKRPSWLIETDQGIFGADQLTAPPVIGE